eukprot:scaffold63517_cov27-Tisochrysis_lutea.AAC.4
MHNTNTPSWHPAPPPTQLHLYRAERQGQTPTPLFTGAAAEVGSASPPNERDRYADAAPHFIVRKLHLSSYSLSSLY